MTSPNKCKLMWNSLKVDILKRIDEIDHETPWTMAEPKWWLDMQQIRREVLTMEENE